MRGTEKQSGCIFSDFPLFFFLFFPSLLAFWSKFYFFRTVFLKEEATSLILPSKDDPGLVLAFLDGNHHIGFMCKVAGWVWVREKKNTERKRTAGEDGEWKGATGELCKKLK